MRWHFGGSNLQPVRMVCEYDWKECPLAIANYIWCEIVTDVLESLTNEVLLWRILLVAVLCWMVLRTAYTKTLSIKKKQQDFSKEHLIKVGFKMQDLELKINILTYKMQYGIWPMPHEISSPSLNDLQHAKLSLSDTGGQNLWARRRLHGYMSKRFGNSNNKDPLSVNKHVSMSEHTELVKRSDSLPRLRNGSENMNDKNLKNYEKLIKTADECRKYMKEISTSNKSLGLFDESSEMSDWNSIKNRLGSESEQNDGTLRLDPTKWYEIYKYKNKIADKSQTHDVNVPNRLTSLGKSNQTVPRWLQTKLSVPIKNQQPQREVLSKIEKKEKTLPPGLSITFLTDHSKKSFKKKTTTDSLKHALNSNDSTCETMDKVKEKLENLDRKIYTSNDNQQQCTSANKIKEKGTKKHKLNTKQSSSAEFGQDNNIRDKVADSSIPIHRQRHKEFRMHKPDENEFMFYLPSYNNNCAVSHKSFHESVHLPLKTATKTQTSFSTHSSCENALNIDFNERDMDNGDAKYNDKRKPAFAGRRESDKHKMRGLSKTPREDLSPESGSQTLLQFKTKRTQNSGEKIYSPSNVGTNAKSMLNLKKHTENVDNDYKRRENNINLYEMNQSRNSPRTHDKRARREPSYSPTPMETEDDVPILSETSSQTEWSRNSDTDDRSTMKLLREALELKKALLMRVNNENQASQSKDTRNESNECDSDDATSKLENHFQSNVLDIISEEQSISSSTEKTSKTYLRSKGFETAKTSDTAQKSVVCRENTEKENCNKIKGFHVDSKSFTIISTKYLQRYDMMDPQTSGWSQQELTGIDGKSLMLRNEMINEVNKRINIENSNQSHDASTNKCEEIEQKQKNRMVCHLKAAHVELGSEKGSTKQQKCIEMKNDNAVNLDDQVSWDAVNKTPSEGNLKKSTGLRTNLEYKDVDAVAQQKLGMYHDKLKFTVLEENSNSILKIDNQRSIASGSNSDVYKCPNYAESNFLDTTVDDTATKCEPRNKSCTNEYRERTDSFQSGNASKHDQKESQGKQEVTGTSQCSETTPIELVDSNMEKQTNDGDNSPLTGRTVICISNSKENSGTIDSEICNTVNTSENEDKFGSIQKPTAEKSNIDEININHNARKPSDHDMDTVIADNDSDDNENHTVKCDPTVISRQDDNEDKQKLPKEDEASNKNETIQSNVKTDASSVYLTDNASDWNVELTAHVNEISRSVRTTDDGIPDIIPGRFSSLPLVAAGNHDITSYAMSNPGKDELFSNSNQITPSDTFQSITNSDNNENSNYRVVYNENITTEKNNTQLFPDSSENEQLKTHLNKNELSGAEVVDLSAKTSESYFDLSNHEFTVSSVILTSETSNSTSNNDKVVENDKNRFATDKRPGISDGPSNESDNSGPIDNEKAMQTSINNIPVTSKPKEPLMIQKSPRSKFSEYLLNNVKIHDEDRVMSSDDWTERGTTNNNICQSHRNSSSITSNNPDTHINVSEQESATNSSSNLEQSNLKANLMFKNEISAQSCDSLTQEGSGSCLNSENNYSKSSISIPKLRVMSRSSSKSGIPVLKSRIDTPKTEKGVERNKGRSRSPLQRPNTTSSQGLEGNSQMGAISCTPRTEHQLRFPYRRRRSVDAVQSENASLIDLSSNVETKLEMQDQTEDNEKCKIVDSISNELRSTSEKCNLLDASGLLTKDCTVIYINIITDNDKNSANAGNSKGQLKQIQYKDMIICNKDTKAKSHELLLKSLKADGLNYVINPINLTSDNKICIDISDHLNPKSEKSSNSSDLEMTDLNMVKNLNEPQPTMNLVADKMLSTQSLHVKQKEMEVLAKPSIKDTSTSVSDFPNDPPNENSLFHDPTNVMISSRRLTQKERILWAEMLINSDSNLMECKKTPKLYNKLGLCFQDQLDHL